MNDPVGQGRGGCCRGGECWDVLPPHLRLGRGSGKVFGSKIERPYMCHFHLIRPAFVRGFHKSKHFDERMQVAS